MKKACIEAGNKRKADDYIKYKHLASNIAKNSNTNNIPINIYSNTDNNTEQYLVCIQGPDPC